MGGSVSGSAVSPAERSRFVKFVTPGQSRAARKLLGWSQTRLAKAAGLGLSTVYDLECQRRDVSAESVEKMRKALEARRVHQRQASRGEVG